MKIPYINLSYKNKSKIELVNIFKKILESGSFVGGQEIKTFEKKIASFCGTKYAVALNSGTDALTFALHLCDLKKGDEVITPPNSFIASTSVIVHLGAKPVFVDVDKNGNMLIDKIESKITKKTKAIIYVHLLGYFKNINRLLKIKKKYKLFLIEDFAQALGAKLESNYAGSLGNLSCTSFDPTKVLSAPGSGGMVFTNDKNLKTKVEKMRYHGKNSLGDHDELGINSQLSSINASCLLVKLRYLKKYQKKRISIANQYINNLKKYQIQLPPKCKNGEHIYHKFVIQVESRQKLKNFLKKNGIETFIHYKLPITKISLFKKNSSIFKTPTADYLSSKSLSLPIHPYLKKKEINFVIKTIEKFFLKVKNY